jgi:hypothetical protein
MFTTDPDGSDITVASYTADATTHYIADLPTNTEITVTRAGITIVDALSSGNAGLITFSADSGSATYVVTAGDSLPAYIYCTDADSDGYYLAGSCGSFAADPGAWYVLQSSANGVDCDDTTYDPTNTCAANDGLCGTNDGGSFTTLTSVDSGNCTNGTVTAFSGSGPWSWSCVADTTDTCTANLLIVGNGQAVYSPIKRINYSAGKYVRYAE